MSSAGPWRFWSPDLVDNDRRSIPITGPMFSPTSPAKADLATDLAIPLLAQGGWSALTLRNMARAGNVTPQAIAAWFPSVHAMRAAIARRYGERWLRERQYLAHRRLWWPDRFEPTALAAVGLFDGALPRAAVALLPATWLEELFDGVWLTVVEAGRWDEEIGSSVAAVLDGERSLLAELLGGTPGLGQAPLEADVDLVLSTVRGLRLACAGQRGEVTSASAGRTSAM
jgi:AcrR family transcriptional regulator